MDNVKKKFTRVELLVVVAAGVESLVVALGVLMERSQDHTLPWTSLWRIVINHVLHHLGFPRLA